MDLMAPIYLWIPTYIKLWFHACTGLRSWLTPHFPPKLFLYPPRDEPSENICTPPWGTLRWSPLYISSYLSINGHGKYTRSTHHQKCLSIYLPYCTIRNPWSMMCARQRGFFCPKERSLTCISKCVMVARYLSTLYNMFQQRELAQDDKQHLTGT